MSRKVKPAELRVNWYDNGKGYSLASDAGNGDYQSIEVNCSHEDALDILRGYARGVLGKRAKLIRRQGYR